MAFLIAAKLFSIRCRFLIEWLFWRSRLRRLFFFWSRRLFLFLRALFYIFVIKTPSKDQDQLLKILSSTAFDHTFSIVASLSKNQEKRSSRASFSPKTYPADFLRPTICSNTSKSAKQLRQRSQRPSKREPKGTQDRTNVPTNTIWASTFLRKRFKNP